MIVVQPDLFDYSVLDTDTREFVQEKAQAIHACLKRMSSDAIAIGQDLIAVKERLGHGQFQDWVQTEFEMSLRTAERWMQYADRFGDTKIAKLSAPSNVLAELLNSDETIIARVETGQIPATIPAIREAKQEAQAEQHNAGYGISPLYSVSQGPPTSYTITVDKDEETEDAPEYPTEHVTLAEALQPLAPSKPFPEIYAPDPGGDAKETRDAHVMRVMGSSESPEWYTPQEIVQLSVELLGEIDLDPCSNSHETPNVPARTLYTKENDGLMQPWEGKVYLNPPYGSEIPQWIEKLVNSYKHGVTEAIALLPARIDTQWFQPLYEFPMCNVRGRLQFSNSPHSAPFPCVIVYLGERIEDFIKVFKLRGPIMRRIG